MSAEKVLERDLLEGPRCHFLWRCWEGLLGGLFVCLKKLCGMLVYPNFLLWPPSLCRWLLPPLASRWVLCAAGAVALVLVRFLRALLEIIMNRLAHIAATLANVAALNIAYAAHESYYGMGRIHFALVFSSGMLIMYQLLDLSFNHE